MTVNQVVSPRLVRVQGASPPWLARLSIDTPVINPAQIFSMFLPGITNYKETTAPQLTDWPRGANPMRCLNYCYLASKLVRQERACLGIKEVPGGRVGRPQKYPTLLWGIAGIGRRGGLKNHC